MSDLSLELRVSHQQMLDNHYDFSKNSCRKNGVGEEQDRGKGGKMTFGSPLKH